MSTDVYKRQVLEVEAVDEPLACLFVIARRNGEHVAHHDQLFVVDLEDVPYSFGHRFENGYYRRHYSG